MMNGGFECFKAEILQL